MRYISGLEFDIVGDIFILDIHFSEFLEFSLRNSG